jgi:multidrug efflux pump subunit AcrA (membrane-fusion protein)
VVGSDGAVRFRPVTIGRDDGDHVELSSGVSDGEQLVLNISNQIAEGEKVRVANAQEPAASGLAMRAKP